MQNSSTRTSSSWKFLVIAAAYIVYGLQSSWKRRQPTAEPTSGRLERVTGNDSLLGQGLMDEYVPNLNAHVSGCSSFEESDLLLPVLSGRSFEVLLEEGSTRLELCPLTSTNMYETACFLWSVSFWASRSNYKSFREGLWVCTLVGW